MRTAFRLLILLGTSVQAGLAFSVRRLRGPLNIAQRAQWLHHWCSLVLRRLRIEISSEGILPGRGLLASNHLSYLDILVFSAISPCVFVSKIEVRSWPLYGWLATMAGTVYVDRARSADTPRANQLMSQALAEGNVVVLFPEGTSTDGTSVLRFHAALFESAVATQELVHAAHIGYVAEQGSVRDDICYWGTMTFLPHLIRLMTVRGIRAEVRFAVQGKKFDDRKAAANATHDVVEALTKPENKN
ncbi:MAG TPA: lysophospholipid acyltransferase family protein [Terriglobales bacterium]|jgi:1-acyl-sn-glycerol-3-phosphate acyltransferase|nr:lysophospholipid acyltransferase family protein [Terriglobales bacterium]